MNVRGGEGGTKGKKREMVSSHTNLYSGVEQQLFSPVGFRRSLLETC